MLSRTEVEAVVVCFTCTSCTLDILVNEFKCSLNSVVFVGADLFPKKWEADYRKVSKQREKAENRYCTVVTVIPYRNKVTVVTAVLYMYVNNIIK